MSTPDKENRLSKGKLKNVDDNYTLALIANVLTNVKDKEIDNVIKRLVNNINLDGKSFNFAKSDKQFTGYFDGQGYTISNFKLDKGYVDENDESLESFSITKDRQIIEFTKDIIKHSHFKPRFFASCWSMPAFMKTNNDRLHGGKLKLEYYELYAEYIYKFLKAYKDEGININYISVINSRTYFYSIYFSICAYFFK